MIKVVLMASYVFMEAVDVVVNHINDKYSGSELPENVRDVYDGDEYKKWRGYEVESSKLRDIRNLVVMITMVAFYASNGYAWVFNAFSGANIYIQYLLFSIVMVLLSTVIATPFGYYDTFVIEERYGLNKSTKKTFIFDVIKTMLVGGVISFALTAVIMFLFERFGNAAILLSSAVMVIVVLIVALIIVPLMRIYNKFTPLEEGELKEKLVELCEKYEMKIKKIVVMDASKRTTSANAFCAGYGKRKTISLDDNLVNNYENEEIVSVFAHELAHAKLKHVLKSIPFTVLRILLIFTGLRIVLNYQPFYTEFGFNGINYIWAQNVLTFITWPLSKGLDAISNYISRKQEYQADAFAAKEGYGDKLISALKRLEKESLADINPHPLKVVLDYSHPTLSQRITAIEGIKDFGEVT